MIEYKMNGCNDNVMILIRSITAIAQRSEETTEIYIDNNNFIVIAKYEEVKKQITDYSRC